MITGSKINSVHIEMGKFFLLWFLEKVKIFRMEKATSLQNKNKKAVFESSKLLSPHSDYVVLHL